MKKIRIMLLSFVVLAAVGGALAFKAKEKFLFDYCTTDAVRNAQGVYTCPNPTQKVCLLLEGVTTTTDSGITPICTSLAPAGGCTGISCPTVTKTKGD